MRLPIPRLTLQSVTTTLSFLLVSVFALCATEPLPVLELQITEAGEYQLQYQADSQFYYQIQESENLEDGFTAVTGWIRGNDTPSINLPTRINGGYKSMDPESLAGYRAKFGRDPVTHRGPDGIKEAIDQIFKRNNFPDKTVLQPAQQQTLLNELHALYAQDARYSHLKLWPVTRDWLKKHIPNNSLIVPN